MNQKSKQNLKLAFLFCVFFDYQRGALSGKAQPILDISPIFVVLVEVEFRITRFNLIK